MKTILIVLTTILSFQFIGQNILTPLDSTLLIQQSLDCKELTNQILKNKHVIHTDTILTIHLEFDEENKSNFTFLNKPLKKYDTKLPKNLEVITWNINFTHFEIKDKKCEIQFEFYPWWRKCGPLKTSSYTNGLYYKITQTYIYSNKKWEKKAIEIKDVKFMEWMYLIDTKCVAEKYKPMNNN